MIQEWPGTGDAVFNHPGKICHRLIMRCPEAQSENTTRILEEHLFPIQNELFIVDIHKVRCENRAHCEECYKSQRRDTKPYGIEIELKGRFMRFSTLASGPDLFPFGQSFDQICLDASCVYRRFARYSCTALTETVLSWKYTLARIFSSSVAPSRVRIFPRCMRIWPF